VRCAWLLLPGFKVVLADQGTLNYWAHRDVISLQSQRRALPQGISFLLSSADSRAPRGSQKGALLASHLHSHLFLGNCTEPSTLHLSRPFASTLTRRTPVPRICCPRRMQPRTL
jgi:hypothetical protein